MDRARILVRTFEATAQELYDGAATFLATTQHVRRVELCDSWRGRDESYDALEALSTSLHSSLQLTSQNMESLLVVGEEQANILERCNRSPIEWRMSQRSLVAVSNEDLADMSNDRPLYHTTHISNNADSNHQRDQSLTPPPVTSGQLPGDTWLPVDDEGTQHRRREMLFD